MAPSSPDRGDRQALSGPGQAYLCTGEAASQAKPAVVDWSGSWRFPGRAPIAPWAGWRLAP